MLLKWCRNCGNSNDVIVTYIHTSTMYTVPWPNPLQKLRDIVLICFSRNWGFIRQWQCFHHIGEVYLYSSPVAIKSYAAIILYVEHALGSPVLLYNYIVMPWLKLANNGNHTSFLGHPNIHSCSRSHWERALYHWRFCSSLVLTAYSRIYMQQLVPVIPPPYTHNKLELR